jgi:hypothetical protein
MKKIPYENFKRYSFVEKRKKMLYNCFCYSSGELLWFLMVLSIYVLTTQHYFRPIEMIVTSDFGRREFFNWFLLLYIWCILRHFLLFIVKSMLARSMSRGALILNMVWVMNTTLLKLQMYSRFNLKNLIFFQIKFNTFFYPS